MKRSYVLAGAAAAMAIALSAPQARADECQAQWHADVGEHTVGYLWAQSGRSCISPLYTGFGKINSLTIASGARDGKAVADGRNSFSYQSRPGFVGQDHFVLAIDGTSPDGLRGVTTVNFDVTVSH